MVMGVLVLMAALVWPNVAGRRGQAQFQYVISTASSMLSLARSESMVSGTRYRCVFEDAGARMVIEHEPEPLDRPGQFEPVQGSWSRLDLAGQGVRCVVVDLDGVYKAIRLKEREVLEREFAPELFEPIEFQPDGRCDSGTIVLSGPSDRAVQLQLSGLTGQVRIVDGWPNEPSTQ
jgi:hypothetical protein